MSGELKVLLGVSEGLGNGVLFTPVISQLADDNPGMQIDVLSSDRAYDVMAKHPRINRIYRETEQITDHYNYSLNSCFRTARFDEPLKRVSDKLLYEPEQQRKFLFTSEIEINLQTLMSEKLIKSINQKFYPTLFPVPDIYEKQKMILMHVGCHSNKHWEKKKWPDNYWLDLISYFKKEMSEYKLCLLCGEHEKEQTNQMANESDVPVFKDTLDKVAALMMASSLLISIDSGIMHLGTTTGIKQIAMFGPTSEIKNKPHVQDNRAIILRKEINCQRCYISDKANRTNMFITCRDNICMKMLSPGYVFETAREMLK
ncbi:MAG: glycosyltransferase family 9 protein [Planctomycetota bacterium]